jgi:hypothetical protein
MLREAWEESGYLYICSEFCELGNINDYVTKKNSSFGINKQTLPSAPEKPKLERKGSLLVKSQAGVEMLREDKVWSIFAEMCYCI